VAFSFSCLCASWVVRPAFEVAVQKYDVFVLRCSVSLILSSTKNCPLAAVLFLVKLMICSSASSVLFAWPFSPLKVSAPGLTAA
jgi:hypothetical protein